MKGDQQLDGAPICAEAGTLKLCSLKRRAILLGGSAWQSWTTEAQFRTVAESHHLA